MDFCNSNSDGNNFLSLFCGQPLILQLQSYHTIQNNYMNELVDRLIKEAGLKPDQAKKAIETIANFVKERFPMLGGAVDQIFGAGSKNDE
jgi:hypothetical protein